MKDHRKERAEARKKAEKLVSQMTLLEKASQLKYDAAPVKRLGVPAYNYWNEALHGVARAGVATMFPQAIAMAAVFDDEEMKRIDIERINEKLKDCTSSERIAVMRLIDVYMNSIKR